MFKKIVMVIVVLLVFGVSLEKSEASDEKGSVYISALELKNELSDKKVKISTTEAIRIAEEKSQGKVVGFRIRRMKFDTMGYALMVLKKDPPALGLIIVHGTTGEIVGEGIVDKYLIVPPEKSRDAATVGAEIGFPERSAND